ncbi:hypothetical protein EJ110_NYTH10088 [Nymphaea thermarum]|nr:hypothetical protein EJ110_NYTH10088 [Nymphaea thermarum]
MALKRLCLHALQWWGRRLVSGSSHGRLRGGNAPLAPLQLDGQAGHDRQPDKTINCFFVSFRSELTLETDRTVPSPNALDPDPDPEPSTPSSFSPSPPSPPPSPLPFSSVSAPVFSPSPLFPVVSTGGRPPSSLLLLCFHWRATTGQMILMELDGQATRSGIDAGVDLQSIAKDHILDEVNNGLLKRRKKMADPENGRVAVYVNR